jgi:peptide-methionine (S)-S-oxide reductase
MAMVLAGLSWLVLSDFKFMNNAHAQAGSQPAEERITFGGGCFWCLEAVFQRLHGVKKVVSGYAGGTVANPTYEAVCSGETGHAEVVQLTFDPTKISFEKLLEVFWAAHDPTTVLEKDTFIRGKVYPKGTAYQGADIGSQYRSIILYENEAQKAAAEKSKQEAQKELKKRIATEIVALTKFYPAEDYHQNYYNQNKNRNPYCSNVITPKLQKLLKEGLIVEEPVLP